MAGKNQHAVRREHGWAVLGAGNSRDTAHYGTQAEAIEVLGQRQQRYLGLAGALIAQDQQAVGWDALGKHITAERGRRQSRKPRVQRD